MSLLFTDTLLTKLGEQLHDAQTLSAVVYRNGLETALSVSTDRLSTGIYSYTVPVPDDWLLTDSVSVHFTFSVNDFNPVTTKIRIGSVQSLRTPDLSDDIANQAANLVISELQALVSEVAAAQSSGQSQNNTSQTLTTLCNSGGMATISGTVSI